MTVDDEARRYIDGVVDRRASPPSPEEYERAVRKTAASFRRLHEAVRLGLAARQQPPPDFTGSD